MALASPRRLGLALLLTVIGLSVGVGAAGFGAVEPDLPDHFTAAPGLPGDKAEYAYLSWTDGVPSKNALPGVRLEHLPDSVSWDSTGKAAVVQRTTVSVVEHDLVPGTGSPVRWGVPMAWANTDERSLSLGLVMAGAPMATGGESLLSPPFTAQGDLGFELYLSDTEYRYMDCLEITLPAGYHVGDNLRIGGFCSRDFPNVDPDDLGGADLPSHHLVLIDATPLEPVGSGESPHGRALVFEAESGGITARFWFVEGISYPVQVWLKQGRDAVLFTQTSFTRGAPLPVPGPLTDLPAREPQPVEAWGPPEGGFDMVLPPSEAWAFAAADADLGFGAFLSSHPDTITERADGEDVVSGVDGSWTFQVRGGVDVFAFQVQRQPATNVKGVDLDVLFPAKLVAQRVDAVDLPANATAPTALPDLASLAASFETMMHRRPSGFELGYGCELFCADQGPVMDVQLSQMTLNSTVPLLLPATFNATGIDVTFSANGTLQRTSELRTHAEQGSILAAAPPPAADATVIQGQAPTWDIPAWGRVATIGAGAGLIGLVYFFWPALKSGFLGLFSRTQDHEVLEHPKRRTLMDAIEAEPGIHMQDLVRKTGQAKTTVEHHLRKMQAAGKIVLRRTGHYTCVFPKATDVRVLAASPALRNASARKVHDAVTAFPGLGADALAQKLAMNRTTAWHHLNNLQQAGLVERQKSGAAFVFFAKAVVPASQVGLRPEGRSAIRSD